jgi:hypothetical protein
MESSGAMTDVSGVASGSGLQIKLKKVKAVARWGWAVSKDADESCGICRNPFDSCCSACKLPGDECPPVWGKVVAFKSNLCCVLIFI